jgi:Zn-dependent protease
MDLSALIPDRLTLISRILILMFSFPIHEFAHAWVADRFGDPTPARDGRLTLNPAVHLELWGSLILLISGFGWARPVMVSPYALRRASRAAPMWVALAGPFSNLMLALLAAIPLRLGLLPADGSGSVVMNTLGVIVQEFVWINLVLLLFNLIPLAPLDGDKVLEFFLPGPLAMKLDAIRPYGPMLLLALVFLGVISWTLMPPLSFLYRLLVG